MKYVLVDCCPVPARLAPVVKQVLADSGATLASCYRAEDVRHLLVKCGKHDQTWLYEHQGTPAQPNPANPPGRSTHELRNDGIAYRGPAGMPLPYWCVGMDVDDGHVQAFIRAAARHGYTCSVTYPGSRSEYHHINFRKRPHFHLPPIKRGMNGLRVRRLTWKLRVIHSPHTHHPYLKGRHDHFGRSVYNAVKQFQADHHQKPDGIVGPQTSRQLSTSYRWWKAYNKKHKR